ncbi:MAG: hypothetical protein ACK4SL_00605 [Candidatus Paceibacteria bacterium]
MTDTSPDARAAQLVVDMIRRLRRAPIPGVKGICYRGLAFDTLLAAIIPVIEENLFRAVLQRLLDDETILLWGHLTAKEDKGWGRRGPIKWLHPDAKLLTSEQRFTARGRPVDGPPSAWRAHEKLLTIESVYVTKDGLPQSVLITLTRGYIAFDRPRKSRQQRSKKKKRATL